MSHFVLTADCLVSFVLAVNIPIIHSYYWEIDFEVKVKHVAIGFVRILS